MDDGEDGKNTLYTHITPIFNVGGESKTFTRLKVLQTNCKSIVLEQRGDRASLIVKDIELLIGRITTYEFDYL